MVPLYPKQVEAIQECLRSLLPVVRSKTLPVERFFKHRQTYQRREQLGWNQEAFLQAYPDIHPYKQEVPPNFDGDEFDRWMEVRRWVEAWIEDPDTFEDPRGKGLAILDFFEGKNQPGSGPWGIHKRGTAGEQQTRTLNTLCMALGFDVEQEP